MAVAGGLGAPWQLDCKNVEQRCGYLLTSGLWSDCTFAVGAETNQAMVPAHKLVLAMASPVFEAMFFGGLSERNDPIVPIPDVHPEAFRALLQYIYTGNINIDTFDMACDLWLGADKYMLPHLVTECNKYIQSVLGPRNACKGYEFALLFNDKPLIDKCIQIIITNTKEVLNDSSFVDVQLNTLITVCSLEHLTVDSELDLFNAVARYAEAEQRRQEQIRAPADGGQPPEELSEKVLLPKSTVDKENLKKEALTIHTALQKIRFLSVSAAQFAAGPARSGLLTEEESHAVLKNILSADSPVPMPTGFHEGRERRQTCRDSNVHCSFETGKLDDTIDALKCGDPSQVMDAVSAACEIFFTPRDIQPALDRGILDALVPALTEGDDKCKELGANAIANLCGYGSSSQLSAVADSAALEPYCRLLTTRGGYTCYSVLRGLTNLLKGVPQLLMTVQEGHDYEDDDNDEDSEDDENDDEDAEFDRKLATDLLQTYFHIDQ